MYFSFAGLGWWLSRSLLPGWGVGAIVDARPLREHQIATEIRRSVLSIVIFAGYGWLTTQAYLRGRVDVSWTASWAQIVGDVAVLFVWNELHFFLCHRLLHTRWLYRHVHRIHHESVTPTPFSTFSFHWFEAVLLGSVMITAMAWHTFSIWALLFLPVMSLLFNTIGHGNYNIFAGTRLRSASAEHARHHRLVAGNYGFYFPVLDRVFGTRL
jgi:sterol desaturase/sphingolipid hydroxylase (fatty acid hydroxylase superfamily)